MITATPGPRAESRARRGTTRRWLRVFVSLSLATALLPLAATRAHAHGALTRSTPAAGDRLTAVPRELRLTFSEDVELALARLALDGPHGVVALGALSLAPDSSRVLVAPIPGGLTAGDYTVRWQVAGSDGHPVNGEYAFTIEPGATGIAATTTGPTAPGQAPPPAEHHVTADFPSPGAFDAESPAYVGVRWLTFVGLLGVIGVAAFRLVVLRRMARGATPENDRFVRSAASTAAKVGLAAVGLLAVALVLRLYAQSYALHGGARALDPGLLGTLLSRTTWGWGWILQALGTVVTLFGLLRARGGSQTGWLVAAAGTVVLAFTPALSGHAASADVAPGLAVLADAAHVLGAGGWLGSLLLVTVVGIPIALRAAEGERGRTVAALVNAFSPTALVFAGIVVATGVFAAWIQLGSVSALWQTGYGRTLLLKLAMLTVVFGTGAYNWLKVKPALGNEVAAGRLRRSATIELAVGAVVLAVTAVLVATATPRMPEMAQGDTVNAAVEHP